MCSPLLSCLTHLPPSPNGVIALALLLQSIAPSFNLTRHCRLECDSLQKIGWQQYEQSCWLEAEQTFQQVFVLQQFLDDGVGMTEALMTLGLVAYQQQKFAQALECYRQALRVSEAANYRIGMGASASQIGWIYYQLGRWALALRAYQHALKIYIETDDYIAVGQALQQLGMVYADSGRSLQAQQYYQLASTILRESTASGQKTGTTEAIGLQNFPVSDEQLNRFNLMPLSYNHQEVLESYRSRDELYQEAVALHTVATLYQRNGLYLSALAYEKQALDLFQLLGEQPEVDQVFYHLGRIYECLGHQKTAMRCYGQVLGNLLKALPDVDKANAQSH